MGFNSAFKGLRYLVIYRSWIIKFLYGYIVIVIVAINMNFIIQVKTILIQSRFCVYFLLNNSVIRSVWNPVLVD